MIALEDQVIGINLQNVWNTSSGTAPFWPTDYFVPSVIPSGVSNPQGANSYFKLMNLQAHEPERLGHGH